MIRRAFKVALALSGLSLAACQTEPSQMGFFSQGGAKSAMEGTWASTDGVLVATFQGGNFTSRFTRTNEVLAQGTYTIAGSQVSMQWLSVATQQERSAACTLSAADEVHCEQPGGENFDLKRSA